MDDLQNRKFYADKSGIEFDTRSKYEVLNNLREKGEIVFENVRFNYSDEDETLKSISLKFPGEKMTALVGQSGAGKTTILNLIPRFYNIQHGDIKIDEQIKHAH